MSNYLGEPQMTVSKEGYVTKSVLMTRGPLTWTNLNERSKRSITL